MKVVALQTWTNGTFTMEEKGVADIPDDLAADLIAKGIVAESPEYYGGNNNQIVELTQTSETGGTTSMTAQEMTDAYLSGKQIIFRIKDYPTLNSYRDVAVSNVQYDHVSGRFSFKALVYESYNIAKIETDLVNATDKTYILTILV